MTTEPTTTTNHDDGACPHCGENDLEWKGDLCLCRGCGRILRRCEVYSRMREGELIHLEGDVGQAVGGRQ